MHEMNASHLQPGQLVRFNESAGALVSGGGTARQPAAQCNAIQQ